MTAADVIAKALEGPATVRQGPPGHMALRSAAAILAALRGAGFAVVPAGFMEAAHDLRIAKGLTSHPLKLRFAEQRGMNGLDAVHAWMIAASDRFDAMVAAAEGGE